MEGFYLGPATFLVQDHRRGQPSQTYLSSGTLCGDIHWVHQACLEAMSGLAVPLVFEPHTFYGELPSDYVGRATILGTGWNLAVANLQGLANDDSSNPEGYLLRLQVRGRQEVKLWASGADLSTKVNELIGSVHRLLVEA
jgi:hypothetical protein